MEKQQEQTKPEQVENFQENHYIKKQQPFLMLPTVDFCFKELMEHEKVRRGFIAAALHISPHEIKATALLPTNLRKGHKKEKLGILDVRVLMQDGTQIDLEMQVGPFESWSERTLFYLSKMYSGQMESGSPYEELAKCIHIGILNFIIFPETDAFYSCFHILEDQRRCLYTDKMEFHVLELPKLRTKEEPQDELHQWAKFLSGKCKEDFMEMASKNEYIDEAYNILKKISADELKRLEYEARDKAVRDYNHQMYTSKRSGIREGIEQGKESTLNLISQLAQHMIADNRTDELISSFTDNALRTKLLEEYHIQ